MCPGLHSKQTDFQPEGRVPLSARESRSTAQTARRPNCHMSHVEVQEHCEDLEEAAGKVPRDERVDYPGATWWAAPLSCCGAGRAQGRQPGLRPRGSTGRRWVVLSCRLSPTSRSHVVAVGRVRWASVPAVAAATSYTCAPAPGTPDVSWVGEDPRRRPEHQPKTSA